MYFLSWNRLDTEIQMRIHNWFEPIVRWFGALLRFLCALSVYLGTHTHQIGKKSSTTFRKEKWLYNGLLVEKLLLYTLVEGIFISHWLWFNNYIMPTKIWKAIPCGSMDKIPDTQAWALWHSIRFTVHLPS